MVLRGLNRAERLSTRTSGAGTTAVCTSKRPPPVIVPTGRSPRVRALKMVVLPDWGRPMMPSFMVTYCLQDWLTVNYALLYTASMNLRREIDADEILRLTQAE